MNVNDLRAEITRNQLTMQEFADALGIDISSLYRRLNGKKAFSLDELKKIAQVLHLSEEVFNQIFFEELFAKTQNNGARA